MVHGNGGVPICFVHQLFITVITIRHAASAHSFNHFDPDTSAIWYPLFPLPLGPYELVQFLRFVDSLTMTLRITYHNAFHQGAQTSFLELIMKIPEALWLRSLNNKLDLHVFVFC